MFCVSIADVSVSASIKAIKSHDLAEIRLDRMRLSPKDMKKVFSSGKNIIASFRPGRVSDKERLEQLKMAIDNGAAYVDVELDSSSDLKNKIIKYAKSNRCKLIISYHNYDATPPKEKLYKIVDKCKALSPDVIKIACKSNSKRDNARLLSLLDSDVDMIVIGMGKEGVITRFLAPRLGAFCTYVSVSEKVRTAEGQLTKKELERL